MDGHAPAPQVIDSQDTRYNIATKVIEHKDLPYRIPVRIQYRSAFWYEAIGGSRIMLTGGLLERRVVEIQDSLNRG